MVSAQELFDTVATHLLGQKKAAKNAAGLCCYRSPDGLRCAVGCLIPDEVYDPSLEGRSALKLWDSPILAHLKEHSALLCDLYVLHDKCPEQKWHTELCWIATAFGLNPKVLETMKEALT
jgi:hypothetical protein